MTIPIIYQDFDGELAKVDSTELPLLDITKYGEAAQSQFTLDQQYDVEYTMNLNTDTKDEDVHHMHLYGMFFQVLSKNGVHVSGSPLS